jgi:hypothetical protein
VTAGLSLEEKRRLRKVANEPVWWVREHVPELKSWEDEFSDLIDNLKAIWEECRLTRVNLCFILRWDIVSPSASIPSIQEFKELQRKQNLSNSSLIFEIDMEGKIIDEIDIGEEIEPACVTNVSQMRKVVMIWLGADFEILVNGIRWNPDNKLEILRNIKSRKRYQLLSMNNHRDVLNIHYEQYVRDEAGMSYWFSGYTNKILDAKPELRFQKSLYIFLSNEVDGLVEIEPMFKDHSRCDIRVVLENFDIYFIEIKWIGFCAVKKRDSPVISAEKPEEYKVARAIAGAFQTKIYIDKNNSVEYNNRIKLGILVVYDGYSPPKGPIKYPDEIEKHPLIDTIEYPLVTASPSVASKMMAKKSMGASASTKSKSSSKHLVKGYKARKSKTTAKAKRRT